MTRSTALSTILRGVMLALTCLAGTQVAYAWDGVFTGTVATVQITNGNNLGFRIFLSGISNMCGTGSNWAYLNESDSNYKTYVAAVLAAKAQGSQVTVYSTLENGSCHIGYLSIQ